MSVSFHTLIKVNLSVRGGSLLLRWMTDTTPVCLSEPPAVAGGYCLLIRSSQQKQKNPPATAGGSDRTPGDLVEPETEPRSRGFPAGLLGQPFRAG
jgi:hypothetical protein